MKPPAKILRVLGNPNPVLERTHVGIYDYLDQLVSLAFAQSVVIETPIADVAAYTTVETVGFPFTKRRLLNFSGSFLVSDDLTNQRTNVDIGLFGSAIKGAVPASGGGSTNFLRADGVWTVPAGPSIFTSVAAGLVPASGGGTTNFIRADGTWAAPPGTGITQLTGDVTAGPGSGSQAATLARIPSATPALGSILFSNIAAPVTPAAGKVSLWTDSTSKNFAAKDDAGNINHGVRTRAATANQWIRSIADDGSSTISQPAFTDISGALAGSQFGPLTGDVTTAAYVATIAANAVTNAKFRQSGALAVVGNAAASSANVADITAGAGSGAALRESGSTIGWGTLATAAYGANTVTYAKLQTTGGSSILLGRQSGSTGNVQEITLGGVMSMSGTVLSAPKQISMTFGGLLTSIGTTLPVFLGVGDNSWSTSSTFGLLNPIAGTSQDWGIIVLGSSLTGGGTYNVSLIVNGINRGTLATISSATTSTVAGATTLISLGGGDTIGIMISTASGTINGGGLAIYVTGRLG